MTIETIRLAARGAWLRARSRCRSGGKPGIRIANHSLKVNGERREWLTVFRKDGSLILWEHFPESRMLGRIPAADIGRNESVGPLLVRRVNALFGSPVRG